MFATFSDSPATPVSAGNVKNVPPPAMELIAEAINETSAISSKLIGRLRHDVRLTPSPRKRTPHPPQHSSSALIIQHPQHYALSIKHSSLPLYNPPPCPAPAPAS